MAHTIEIAKSGRAGCRTCRQPIPKGELRFGEETVNAFSDTGAMTYQWHHLMCAAKKKPSQLEEAMKSFVGEIPNRAEVEAVIAIEGPKQKPTSFPYAERAPTNRSRCGECGETIEKGEIRIATPREVEGAGMQNPGARYLHPPCAVATAEGEPEGVAGMVEKIRKNSRGLSKEELDEIAAAMG